MSNRGSNVSTAIRATNIAKPVRTPNIIVGMKFDKINIEKPKNYGNACKNIALPIVE